MPEVKQLDWSKLTPKEPKHRQTHSTRNFDVVEIIGKRKNSKHSDIKVTRRAVNPIPSPYKCSKCEYVASDRKDSKRHWHTEH